MLNVLLKDEFEVNENLFLRQEIFETIFERFEQFRRFIRVIDS